jgi:O-antigen/teichoic acid export membrane protein
VIERFRHLLRHSVFYSIPGLAQRLIGFLLIPLYTRFLTPADYGILALAGLLQTALAQVQLLGLPSAMTRSYILLGEGEVDRRETVATGSWTLLVVSILLGGALAFSARPLAVLVFGDPEKARFVYLVAIGAPFAAIESVRFTLFRILQASKAFALVGIAALVLGVVLAVTLVVVMRWGAFGMILAAVATTATIALVFLPWFVRALKARFRPRVLRDMLEFGLPLVPAGFAVWGFDLMDRYILRLYRSMDEVGLYSIGYRFGMVLALITMAFRTAWPQVVFTQGKGDEATAKQFFAHTLTYYFVVTGFVALGIASLADDALRFLTPPAFHPAAGVVPLIALSYTLQGSFIILEVGIDLKKRTGFIPLFTGLAAALNLGLNLLLIPPYGMYGAAWATLAACLVVPTAYYLVNQKLYPIRWQWGRIAMALLAAGTLFAAGKMIDTGRPALDAALRAALVLAYPGVLWVLPFPLPEERARVKLWIRRLRERGGG